MACPGSINLSSTLPPAPTTSYAQEGTAAHSLAQLSLEHNVDCSTYIGTNIVVENTTVEVTEDMAEFTQVYVDYVKKLRDLADQFWIEKRFNLADLNPPGPMFGTSDFSSYNALRRTLTVVDLKYGVGVIVEPTTPQAKYYALGAALTLDPATQPIDDVVLVIVQPRATHVDGPIRQITIPFSELIEFAGELMDKARATLDPNAPLVPGPHCRFCPAAGICPAQRDQAQALAQIDFAEAPFLPPGPETLSIEVFADILSKKHILEDWLKAVDARALSMLERGEEVPGWKLVARRAVRKWNDVDAARNYLEADGFDEGDIYEERVVKSPAQIEKRFGGKKKFETAMGSFVTKQSSGYTMARSTDTRPAVALTPGSDFDALPASTQDQQATRNENETA